MVFWGHWYLVFGVVFSVGLQAAPTLEYVERVTKELNVEALKQHRTLSLNDVIERVGKDFPEMRENYIPLHDSQSLQSATYRYPRIISFSPDASFAMAFNGDPTSHAYNELEMFDTADGHFRFRRIVFAASPESRTHLAKETSPTVHPINEPLCLGCHGADPRPNWESYRHWPGTFHFDDEIHIGRKYRLPFESEVHEGFDEFYTKEANKGRYSFLRKLEEKYVNSSKYEGGGRPDENVFTQAVASHNYKRVLRLMKATKDYDKFKYAFLGALYECQNFWDFLPAKVVEKMKKPLSFYEAATIAEFNADLNKSNLAYRANTVARWRYLLEGRGISMDQWSMSFRLSPYSFVTPGGDYEGFITAMMIDDDKSLEPYRVFVLQYDKHYRGVTTEFSKPWVGSMTSMVSEACKALAPISREALEKL